MNGFIRKSYHLHRYLVRGDGRFPNNERFPVLVYEGIIHIPFFMPFTRLKKFFRRNGWNNSWKGGIFNYLHYHSNTPEMLAVFKGKTTLLFGGQKGIKIKVKKGDVIIIPAGVAHKNLGDENQVSCLGAYPGRRNYDILTGEEGERPGADVNISLVPLPSKDPVFGVRGGLQKYWK